MTEEIWLDIKNYEGLYQVSDFGRVKSLKSNKEKILKPFARPNGYLGVTLSKKGKSITKSIHRIVAETFISNQNKLLQVNHKDGNKQNNNVNNLEWCTAQENIKHSWKNGLSRVTEGMREHCKVYNKKVMQYDKNENFIKEWESASEAGRKLNIFQQSIVACLKNRTKTAGGYIWRYKAKEEK